MLTMNAGSRLILYLDCIFKLPENDRFVRQLWENRSGYNNDTLCYLLTEIHPFKKEKDVLENNLVGIGCRCVYVCVAKWAIRAA